MQCAWQLCLHTPVTIRHERESSQPGGQLSPGRAQSGQQKSSGIWQIGQSSFSVSHVQKAVVFHLFRN